MSASMSIPSFVIPSPKEMAGFTLAIAALVACAGAVERPVAEVKEVYYHVDEYRTWRYEDWTFKLGAKPIWEDGEIVGGAITFDGVHTP